MCYTPAINYREEAPVTYICQCGCGQPIPPKPWHRFKAPRYINGHAQRAPEFKEKWAKSRAASFERPPDAPVYICQCGCNEEIPWRPLHKTHPPKYIQAHYLRMGTTKRVEALRKAKEKARMQPPDGWQPPTGRCECGCGKKTKISKMSRPERGEYYGYPLRFIHGHNARTFTSQETSRWKGGKIVDKQGYELVKAPHHPRAQTNGYIAVHRLVYEETRGVALPPNILIHHVNGIKNDNRPENLVASTRMEHARAHRIANEIIGIFYDDLLLESVTAYVRQHGVLPDLEALTMKLYSTAEDAD